MKTLTTKIEGREIIIRGADEEHVMCSDIRCEKRGKVYCCYTFDFQYCDRFKLEERMKQWNQL
jgi:hypothetical protein